MASASARLRSVPENCSCNYVKGEVKRLKPEAKQMEKQEDKAIELKKKKKLSRSHVYSAKNIFSYFQVMSENSVTVLP